MYRLRRYPTIVWPRYSTVTKYSTLYHAVIYLVSTQSVLDLATFVAGPGRDSMAGVPPSPGAASGRKRPISEASSPGYTNAHIESEKTKLLEVTFKVRPQDHHASVDYSHCKLPQGEQNVHATAIKDTLVALKQRGCVALHCQCGACDRRRQTTDL